MKLLRRARVRIPIGLLYAILMYLLAVGLSREAFAVDVVLVPESVVLPFYNADGYSTVTVLVNPTDAALTIHTGLVCNLCDETIPAHSFVREPSLKTGIGVEHRSLPEGLIAYSEITTPIGALANIGPLKARETARLYDLGVPAKFNPGLFVAAESATTVTVLGGQSVALDAGQGAILSVNGTSASLVNQLGGGKFYVFAYKNDQVNGSIQILESYD